MIHPNFHPLRTHIQKAKGYLSLPTSSASAARASPSSASNPLAAELLPKRFWTKSWNENWKLPTVWREEEIFGEIFSRKGPGKRWLVGWLVGWGFPTDGLGCLRNLGNRNLYMAISGYRLDDSMPDKSIFTNW